MFEVWGKIETREDNNIMRCLVAICRPQNIKGKSPLDLVIWENSMGQIASKLFL